MKRTHAIRLADDKVDAVEYRGPSHAKGYMRKLVAQLPIDTDRWEKLTDFATHRRHLTQFCIDIVEGRVQFGDDSPMTLAFFSDYVWQCYVIAHRRANLLQGTGVEEAVRGMWALFMYIKNYKDRGVQDSLRQKASDFLLCQYTENYSAQICVSTAEVGKYTVQTHWQAATALVPILYEFPYSPAMYDYVQALLMRHAQFLNGVDNVNADAMDIDEVEEVYDSPLYCSRTVGRLFYVDPTNPNRLLNDLYLGHAEILFGPQMIRINRVRWLSQRALSDHVVLDMSHPDINATNALVSFMERLSSDDVLRRFVVDPMREQLLRTHVMHGERARFARLHPKQEPEPDNILATLRHNDYEETPALLVTPLGEMARGYRDALKNDQAIVAWASRPRITYERELMLGITVTIGTWMIYQGAPSDFVSKRIHMEEMHVGLDELANPFLLPDERPALVRCMRWHFVFDLKDRIVYAGTNPIAALGHWLRLVRDETVGRLKLNPSVIHELLRPLVASSSSAAPGVPTSVPSVPTTTTSTSFGTGVSFVKL